MVNKLLVVGISGVAIGIVCISAACILGAKTLQSNGFDFSDMGLTRCDFNETGQPGIRSIAWSGGDHVSVELPATVHYRRGSGDQVVVKGDNAVLSHIRVADGHIRMDCHRMHNDDRLDVTLPGREFRIFTLAGSGSVQLDGIDQPDLKIRLEGSGDIEASGKTDNLELRLAGSGDAHLGTLTAGRVNLELAGSNDVEVAPIDDLNVRIAGSGKVTLRTEPHTLETHILGSGHIIHPDLDKGI